MQMISSTRVTDFNAWKEGFERFEELRRREGGLTTRQVYRSVSDDHEIVIVFEVEDEARARDFLSSAQVQEAMRSAGATRAPIVGVLGPLRQAVS